MTGHQPGPVRLALALSKSDWEAGVVAALADRKRPTRSARIAVDVRRCVDVADLLASVGGGARAAAVIDARFPRIAADVIARLSSSAVPVVAVCSDEQDERLMRQIGVASIAVVDRGDPARTATSIIDLITAGPVAPDSATGVVAPGVADAMFANACADAAGSGVPTGRLIAVWGPPGAPGRTSIALALAHATSQRGLDTLVIDADTHAPGVADALGLASEGSGLVAAAGLADRGALQVHSLARQARQLAPKWRVLTGIREAERWPEVPPAAAAAVFRCARVLVDLVVVDVGAHLERDDELLHDQLVPRRDASSIAAVAAADTVVAVSGSEPVSLARLIGRLPSVRAAADDTPIVGVVNRVRASLGAGCSESGLRDVLGELHLADLALIPDDQAAFDAAIRRQLLPTEAAPKSAFAAAIGRLADRVLSEPMAMVSGY